MIEEYTNAPSKYTEEFKHNAVKMVLTGGLARTEVGRRLETSSKNTSRWVTERQENDSVLETEGKNLAQLRQT